MMLMVNANNIIAWLTGVSGGKILPKMAAMKDGFRGAFFRRGSQFLPVHPF